MKLSLQQVLNKTISSLNLVEKKLACSQLFNISDINNEGSLLSGQALCLWVVDLLASTKLTNFQNALFVVYKVKPTLLGAGEAFDYCVANKVNIPFKRFMICDREYFSITHYTDYIRLSTCDNVQSLESMPLETISYDLGKLFIINLSKLRGNDNVELTRNIEAAKAEGSTNLTRYFCDDNVSNICGHLRDEAGRSRRSNIIAPEVASRDDQNGDRVGFRRPFTKRKF